MKPRCALTGMALALCSAGLSAQRQGLVIERGALQDGLLPARLARWADLDRNGLPDVVRLRPGGLEVLRQDLAGRLHANTVPGLRTGPGGPQLVDLAVGRLDPSRDPFDDVAVLYSDGSVDVLVNDGTGNLQVWLPRPANPGVTGPGRQILVADLNGDPLPDLLVLMDFIPPVVLVGTPAGFRDITANAMPTTIGLPRPHAAAADLDGDGDTDLALVGGSLSPLLLLENLPGGFAIRNIGPSAPRAAALVLAVDLIGSPLPELVVGASGNGLQAPLVLQNLGALSFSVVTPGGFQLAGVEAMAAGDVTGDGSPDLLAQQADGALLLGVHDGTGRFGPARPILDPGPRGNFALGDFEGDADLDLYVPGSGLEDQILLGNGRAAFADLEQTAFPIGALPSDIPAALVDADGNGDTDLVAFSPDGAPMPFLNDGTLRFELASATALVPPLPSTTLWRELRAVSVLGGDRADLVALGNANPINPSPVRILVRRNGGYVDETNARWPLSRPLTTLAPLPRNGRDDLVAGTPGGDLLLLANQAGVFRQVAAFRPGLGVVASRILAGDLDRSGSVDVVVLQPAGSPRVFLSTPAAGFVEVPGAVSAAAGAAGDLADLDGDGVLDLLLAGGTGGTAGPFLLRGTGNGSFVDATARLLPRVPAMLLTDAVAMAIEGVPRLVLARHDEPDLLVTWNGTAYGPPVELPYRGSLASQRLLPGDLDRDGDAELVVLRRGTAPLLLRGDSVHLGQVGPAQVGRLLELRLVSPGAGTFAALALGSPSPPVPTPFGIVRLRGQAVTVWTRLLLPGQRQARVLVPVPTGLGPALLPFQAAFLDASAPSVHLSNLEIARVLDF